MTQNKTALTSTNASFRIGSQQYVVQVICSVGNRSISASIYPGKTPMASTRHVTYHVKGASEALSERTIADAIARHSWTSAILNLHGDFKVYPRTLLVQCQQPGVGRQDLRLGNPNIYN